MYFASYFTMINPDIRRSRYFEFLSHSKHINFEIKYYLNTYLKQLSFSKNNILLNCSISVYIFNFF